LLKILAVFFNEYRALFFVGIFLNGITPSLDILGENAREALMRRARDRIDSAGGRDILEDMIKTEREHDKDA